MENWKQIWRLEVKAAALGAKLELFPGILEGGKSDFNSSFF